MIDKNKILKIITSSPVLKVLKETQKIELVGFYNMLEALFKRDIPYGTIGQKLVLCIALTFENQGEWNIFDNGVLASKIKEGLLDENNVILSNSKGDVINVIKGIYINDYVEAEEFSREHNKLVLFIDNKEVHIFKDGTALYYIRNIVRDIRRGVKTPESFPSKEYRRLIENQYQSMVYKQKAVKYWENKANRILINNPEIHFHKCLFWYLDQYVEDGKVDSGATIAGTDDRTDIRILAFDGGLYIIEIKCLGKTKLSLSEKSDVWANEGLIQLGIYLEDEKDSKIGVLVLYDGRKESKDIIWNHEIEWHPKMDRNPMRFFLESESASVKARTIYTALKRKKRGYKKHG